MSRRWLILDGNFLAYRAFYSTGGLKHQDMPTGVIYGFLRDVLVFQDRFATQDVVFAFDHGRQKREDLLPAYKESRKKKRLEWTDEEKANYEGFKRQLEQLKTSLLRRIGFRNVYYQDGYEADDHIASFVEGPMAKRDSAVIVSADKDLYQLLNPRVAVHNPAAKTNMTLERFRKEYGISPNLWPTVKAMAGCDTDDVPNVPGVKDKTAIKYLLGQLKPSSKTHKTITSLEYKRLVNENLQIVLLPFRGTKEPVHVPDEVTPASWHAVTKELGFKSIDDVVNVSGVSRKPLRE